MADDYDQMFAAGRERLAEWLPKARAEFTTAPPDMKLGALANATAPYVTEDNFDSLVIYPGKRGGWHADLVLRAVPPGVPNTMGTPVGSPCATWEEAENHGRKILTLALAISAENRAAPKAHKPVFLLYDATIKLEPAGLAYYAQHEFTISSRPIIAAALDGIIPSLFPDGCSKAKFEALSDNKKLILTRLVYVAALAGIYAYPLRKDAPPVAAQSSAAR